MCVKGRMLVGMWEWWVGGEGGGDESTETARHTEDKLNTTTRHATSVWGVRS